MIHHFARALAIREQARAQRSSIVSGRSSHGLLGSGAQAELPFDAATPQPPQPPQSQERHAQRLSIRRDPHDARRAVIAGRFADVCAALDRMAAELEAA